jgi:hypothetical protein
LSHFRRGNAPPLFVYLPPALPLSGGPHRLKAREHPVEIERGGIGAEDRGQLRLQTLLELAPAFRREAEWMELCLQRRRSELFQLCVHQPYELLGGEIGPSISEPVQVVVVADGVTRERRPDLLCSRFVRIERPAERLPVVSDQRVVEELAEQDPARRAMCGTERDLQLDRL